MDRAADGRAAPACAAAGQFDAGQCWSYRLGGEGVVADGMRVQVSAESLAEGAIEPDLIAGNVESDGADVDGDETYYWTRRQARRSLAFWRDLYRTLTR